ncbi:MAG: hypothetical protein Q4G66_12880 [bacterium]|nr:hypothetical protein [bacterium]
MDSKWSLEEQREAAKLAMTISMVVTVFTGPYVRRNRNMRLTHTIFGVALVAGSVWHNSLYSVRDKGSSVKCLSQAEPAASAETAANAANVPVADES